MLFVFHLFVEKEMFSNRFSYFREADHARRKEYKEYLHNVDTRLDDRPLLFQRESQTNAKRQARRRYEEILQQAGVEGEMLKSILNASTKDNFTKEINE